VLGSGFAFFSQGTSLEGKQGKKEAQVLYRFLNKELTFEMPYVQDYLARRVD
jgi:hypothetical protein